MPPRSFSTVSQVIGRRVQLSVCGCCGIDFQGFRRLGALTPVTVSAARQRRCAWPTGRGEKSMGEKRAWVSSGVAVNGKNKYGFASNLGRRNGWYVRYTGVTYLPCGTSRHAALRERICACDLLRASRDLRVCVLVWSRFFVSPHYDSGQRARVPQTSGRQYH